MAQGDLGTSIVFVGIFFAMLFWAGVPWQLLILLASPVISLILGFDPYVWGAWFLLLLALVLWYKPFLGEGLFVVAANAMMGIVGPLLWEHMKPYRQNRLKVFLDPSVDPRGSGYHVIQSITAIGSGGWFGRGYLNGPQKRGGFLPEQYTDFIFAVVGEELGFIGVMIALTLFLFLFLRVIRISERANDSFSSLVAFGLLASWFTHVLENVGRRSTSCRSPIRCRSSPVGHARVLAWSGCWRASRAKGAEACARPLSVSSGGLGPGQAPGNPQISTIGGGTRRTKRPGSRGERLRDPTRTSGKK
jgi:cell division protein FtsW (lipid II flippase)